MSRTRGETKGERREAQRQKQRQGMRVSGASIRRIQMALIEREQKKQERLRQAQDQRG